MENENVDKKEKHKIFSKAASCLFVLGVSFFVIVYISDFFLYRYDMFFYCYLMPELLKTALSVLFFASPVLLLLALLLKITGLIIRGFKKEKINTITKVVIFFLSLVFIFAFIFFSLPGAGRCSRGKTAALKATAHGLRPAILMCCDNPAGVLLTTPGEDICNPPIGVKLPFAGDFDQKGAVINYNAQAQCNNTTPRLHIHFSEKVRITECTDITVSEIEALFGPDCH